MIKSVYLYVFITGIILSSCDLRNSDSPNNSSTTLTKRKRIEEKVKNDRRGDKQNTTDSELLIPAPEKKKQKIADQERSMVVSFIPISEDKEVSETNNPIKRKRVQEKEENNTTSEDKLSMRDSELPAQAPEKKKQKIADQENVIIGNLISTSTTEEGTEKEVVANSEPVGYKSQMLNNKTAKGYSVLQETKAIRQRLEETNMQDPKAQQAIIRAILERQIGIQAFPKEDCIPFVLAHAKQGEKNALIALLWFFKKYPKNPLLISHDLNIKMYEDLLVSLTERTGDLEIDGRNAFYIGEIYSCTAVQGLQANATKAIDYYEIAIQMGNPDAAFNLGLLYEDGVKDQLEPNATRAIEYYEMAIQLGNARAANNLGLMYKNGMKDQLEPNATKAIQYYEMAIQLGVAGAALNLGVLYAEGLKDQLEPNATKAIQYYQMAIQLGDTQAAFNLALLYKKGVKDQLEPNLTKAIHYYEIAVQMGNASALNNLALLYKKGIKDQLEPNPTKAIQYYEIAIQLGNASAANNLANLYKNGIKDQLEPNATKAIEYYQKAIELGDANAANNLALLYKKGLKDQLEPNPTKAIKYYKIAVQLKNADAAFNLGLLYQDGVKDQLEPNITKAIHYYKIAIKLGDTDAANNLALLYEYGIKGQLQPSKQLAFKTYHDTYLATKNEELCKHLKKLIVRNSSTNIAQLDLEESNQNLTILIENVKLLVGLMLFKKEENNPFSQAIHFMDNYMVPEFLPCYTALSEYLDNVLETTKYLSEPAFMVDCIKINSKRAKKYIENGDHLHEYTIDDHSYLCLGEDNVKAAMVLIGLLENEHTVKQNIVEIKKFLSESPDSEIGKRLQEQAMKKLPEGYAGTLEEYMAERLEETLDMLDKVEIVSSQLKEIVLATTLIRNKGCSEVYSFLFEED